MIVGGRTRNSNNWVLLVAIGVLVAGVLIIALTCGGGGDGDGARAEEPQTTPTTQVAAVTTQPPSPTPQPSPSPAIPASGSTYVIAPGDTLFDLAVSWNTTVDAIVAANSLDDPAALSIGQEIKVP